jgi:hypothetical protein
MIEDMAVRNLSPATQRSYISAVSKFSRYFGRSPDKLELEDVRAFQVHLVSTGISWPALNQIVCSLRFFYGVTLGEAFIPERIPYARELRKLLVVLSPDEAVSISRSRVGPEEPGGAHLLLRGWTAGVRGRRSHGRRRRQRAGRHPGPAWQRREGSQCDTVGAVAFCAPIGGWPGRAAISFPAATRISRSIRPSCTPLAGRRQRRQG